MRRQHSLQHGRRFGWQSVTQLARQLAWETAPRRVAALPAAVDAPCAAAGVCGGGGGGDACTVATVAASSSNSRAPTVGSAAMRVINAMAGTVLDAGSQSIGPYSWLQGSPQERREAQRVLTAGEGAADAVNFGVEGYGESHHGSGGRRRAAFERVVGTARRRRRERWSTSCWALTAGLLVTSARP